MQTPLHLLLIPLSMHAQLNLVRPNSNSLNWSLHSEECVQYLLVIKVHHLEAPFLNMQYKHPPPFSPGIAKRSKTCGEVC